ncbi:hypothetical protein BHYA_0005g00020 [Botrytis hyacinthi]|uniref:Uncharacterized protein n=1 Tax=Botrytis hyacinthi TaxID=278943 RepID=A0A4Z1H2Z1_9HELO|nr:hypothetical protein BHYA_0005g00020 [Botrytis hyacinthi]
MMLNEFMLKFSKNGKAGSGPIHGLGVCEETGGTTGAVPETLKTYTRPRVASHINWISFGSKRSEAKFVMTASSPAIFPQPSSEEIASTNHRAQNDQGT